MHNNRSRGFTLIELLVVIAIIGILSSVVLASLNTARSKGNDAKVQTQMQSIQTAAEVYYSSTGNYGTSAACATMTADTSSGMSNLFATTAWPNSTAPICLGTVVNGFVTAYSVVHDMTTPSGAVTKWCVDSTGASKSEVTGWTQTVSC